MDSNTPLIRNLRSDCTTILLFSNFAGKHFTSRLFILQTNVIGASTLPGQSNITLSADFSLLPLILSPAYLRPSALSWNASSIPANAWEGLNIENIASRALLKCINRNRTCMMFLSGILLCPPNSFLLRNTILFSSLYFCSWWLPLKHRHKSVLICTLSPPTDFWIFKAVWFLLPHSRRSAIPPSFVPS